MDAGSGIHWLREWSGQNPARRIGGIDKLEQEVLVRYEDREVVYDFNELDELQPAYAMTVHKSQGSEYPVVVMPVHTQHFMMLQRNRLYTAITRGKKLVILVGTKKALAIAARRTVSSRRVTTLRQRLVEQVEGVEADMKGRDGGGHGRSH